MSGDLVEMNLFVFEGVVSGRYESNDRSNSSTFLLCTCRKEHGLRRDEGGERRNARRTTNPTQVHPPLLASVRALTLSNDPPTTMAESAVSAIKWLPEPALRRGRAALNRQIFSGSTHACDELPH
mmetsp:Transcript_82142/g.232574  ORF Transcript_82142/g.232574 Transcript_82142/m.232574 type:complete len:125 (+) Transcript_82142:311-685(+)